MIKQTTKIKRGTSFVLNNKNVWCYLDKGTTVLVCDEFNFNLQANFWDVERDELKPAKEFRQGISAKPKQLTESEKSFKKELNVFFASQILETPKRCENCEIAFNLNSKWDYRKITCHILPKSLFKELAIHPQNRVFMCCDSGCFGHDKYDNGDGLERSQMTVYKVAVERYQKLKESLTEAKIIKANKYLNIK